MLVSYPPSVVVGESPKLHAKGSSGGCPQAVQDAVVAGGVYQYLGEIPDSLQRKMYCSTDTTLIIDCLTMLVIRLGDLAFLHETRRDWRTVVCS